MEFGPRVARQPRQPGWPGHAGAAPDWPEVRSDVTLTTDQSEAGSTHGWDTRTNQRPGIISESFKACSDPNENVSFRTETDPSMEAGS